MIRITCDDVDDDDDILLVNFTDAKDERNQEREVRNRKISPQTLGLRFSFGKSMILV